MQCMRQGAILLWTKSPKLKKRLFENEESKTESEITTQFLTSQDASASFVFKVHEYYDESLIRGGSDEVCDVSIFDRIDDEIEPWLAVDQIKDHKDLDERELENDESDTESDITVLSYTSQDANAPEYDDERHIRGGSDEVCDVSIPYWTENEIKLWSAIDIHHTEDLKDSDEREFENDDSDTESDITGLSYTSQDANAPEYDDERHIRGGSDEVCDVSIPYWTENEIKRWSAIDIRHTEDSAVGEFENEDSDTDSDITVLSTTYQFDSDPAVFNVPEYDEEWKIRRDSDEVCDVSILDLTEDETEPWSAIDIDHVEDRKEADEHQSDNEYSDTESEITVLSPTIQDASATAVSNVNGYYDESNTIEGSDDYNDGSVLGLTEDETEPWSAIDNGQMKVKMNKLPSNSNPAERSASVSKRAKDIDEEDLNRLKKKRQCLKIIFLQQKIAQDKELHQLQIGCCWALIAFIVIKCVLSFK